MKRTSITDLARLLSLHPSTISRALSDHPDISPETRERVHAAAKTFQYRPNLHARFFRKKNSGLVALILPEFNMFFMPGLMKGVNDVLKEAGMSVIIFTSDNSTEKEREIVDHCLSWMVEGVLISLASTSQSTEHLVSLKEAGIQVVIMDKIVESPLFSTLTINEEDAVYQAVNHLISSGKSKILGLFGHPELPMTKIRIQGFTSALVEAGLTPSRYDIVCAVTPDTGRQGLEERIRSTPYDGLFVMSDELLMLAMPVLTRLTLYPASVSIVSISDGVIPYQIYPAVTHIRHSGQEIGLKAASLLLSSINDETDVQHIKLPVRLQVESSVF